MLKSCGKINILTCGSISGPVISVVSSPVTRIPPAETDSVLHTTDFKYQNDSFSHVVVHQYEPWLLFGEDVIANLWLVWLLFAICCSWMIFGGVWGRKAAGLECTSHINVSVLISHGSAYATAACSVCILSYWSLLNVFILILYPLANLIAFKIL